MKKTTLILFALILSFFNAIGQGFPTSAKGVYPDFEMRESIEGEPDNFWGQYIGIVPTGTGSTSDTQVNMGSKTYFPTDIVFIKNLYVENTGPVSLDVLMSLNSPTAGGVSFNVSFMRFVIPASGHINVPINQWLQQGCQISASAMRGDGTTSVIVRWGFTATRFTADLNWQADKTILWIGDSISRFSSGQPATVTASQNFSFLVRDYYANLGYDIRIINKAKGGYSSTDIENWRKTGYLNHARNSVNIIFYAISTNDALQNISNSITTTNVTNFMNFCKRNFKGVPVVFVGGAPLNDNTAETRLIAVRTLIQNLVNADATGQFKYVSLASAFDRTVLSNYNNPGTGADGIHPIAALHGSAMAPIITSFLSTNNILPK